MKKLVLVLGMAMVLLISLMQSAMASANSGNIEIGSILERTKYMIVVESYDLEVGEEQKGGKLVAKRVMDVDSLFGTQQLVANNKKMPVTLASPLSDTTRISAVIIDKSKAFKLHQTMQATNSQTVAKQKGQVFRWETEEYKVSDVMADKLDRLGIYRPVRMTIVANKVKDPQSIFVKSLKGIVAAAGIWKTVDDWNKDYSDLNSLLTSAIMIESLTKSGSSNTVLGADVYAIPEASLCGGF